MPNNKASIQSSFTKIPHPRRSRHPFPYIYPMHPQPLTMHPHHPNLHNFPADDDNDNICNNNNDNTNNNIFRAPSSNLPVSAQQQLQPRRHHGSSSQACAACKYQRRKCASDCVLAPYFPHDRQRQFLNAHRLFGVSNIIKIVRHLDPSAKDHAMRTIIFQSDARAADPVGGCFRMIRDLEERISIAKAELDIVLHQLAICRAAAAQQQVVPLVEGGDAAAVAVGAMHGGDLEAYDDEKWRGEYVREDEVVNSWGCNIPAESTDDSFPPESNNNNSNNNLEECANDIGPILEQLTCDDHDDVREEDQFRFDSNGNIVSSNDIGVLAEEKGEYKEDDCFSRVQDHSDLKAAATFFSLTNCDI